LLFVVFVQTYHKEKLYYLSVERDHAQLQSYHSICQKEYQQMKTDYRSLTEQVFKLVNELQSNTSQQQLLLQTNAELTKKLAQLETTNKSLQTELSQQQETHQTITTNLKSEIEAKDKELSELHTRVTIQHAENELLRQQVVQSVDSLRGSVDSATRSWHEHIEHLLSTADEKNHEIKQLKTQMKSYWQQLTKGREYISTLLLLLLLSSKQPSSSYLTILSLFVGVVCLFHISQDEISSLFD